MKEKHRMREALMMEEKKLKVAMLRRGLGGLNGKMERREELRLNQV